MNTKAWCSGPMLKWLNFEDQKKENKALNLKVKCTTYEKALNDIKNKVETKQTKADGANNKD